MILTNLEGLAKATSNFFQEFFFNNTLPMEFLNTQKGDICFHGKNFQSIDLSYFHPFFTPPYLPPPKYGLLGKQTNFIEKYTKKCTPATIATVSNWLNVFLVRAS